MVSFTVVKNQDFGQGPVPTLRVRAKRGKVSSVRDIPVRSIGEPGFLAMVVGETLLGFSTRMIRNHEDDLR